MSHLSGAARGPSRARSQTARGEHTRQLLLAAAEEVFGERGYDQAAISEITRRAGVAQGTFYVHFPDKKEAFVELVRHLNERLREHLGSPFAAGVPNRDILLCFRNDDETVEKLRDQIQKDYRRMPHQVTDKLLLITQDGIAPRD